MEERRPIWKVAANILNKQLRTADKGCSSSFGVGRGANTNSPSNSGVPRNFVRGGGSTNSVEDREQRERGYGEGSPLVGGSGGSCILVQEISFHIVKVS